MVVTKEQAKLIAELAGQIREKYGLVIGYLNPQIPMPQQGDADFIIYESSELETLHCFYKDDIEVKPVGPHMIQVLPSEPKHDEKVQDLISRLNNDLFEGKIWFDPVATRKEGDLEVEVIRKKIPHSQEDIFATNIRTEKFGTLYTYEFISNAASYDKRFKIAKELIDENWPRPAKSEAQIEEQARKSGALMDFLSKILKQFGI